MLSAYLEAALYVALLACGWVAIDRAWRRTFGQRDDEPTPGCRGCLVCTRRCAGAEGPAQPPSRREPTQP